MVNGPVNFIKKGHEIMIVATFNKVNGGPRMLQDGIRET